MKINYFNFILMIAFLFQGCGQEEVLPGIDGDKEPAGEEYFPIELGGSGLNTVTISRALEDFPNQQQIGVVAARYTAGSIDWTSYDDINNAMAIADLEENDIFYFNFSPIKYWPFDGTELVFLAYSPVADGAAVTLEAGRTQLDIQLVQDMPDVMYASNNETAATTPYSKAGDPIVDLGEFRHALSQLTIEVIADATMNPQVRLDALQVRTASGTATLDLLDGDNGLTVMPAAPGSTPIEYDIVNTRTDFRNGFSANLILLPGSEDDTEIYVRFYDRAFFYENTYPVSAFTNANGTNSPIRFVQGLNTTLQFRVIGIPVDHPEDAIYLQGQLTDWKQRPDLGVTIN